MIQRRRIPEERAKAVEPPAAFEARGGLVGERCAVQHTGIVDQCRQRTEPLDDLVHSRVPLLLGRDVELHRADGAVVESFDWSP